MYLNFENYPSRSQLGRAKTRCAVSCGEEKVDELPACDNGWAPSLSDYADIDVVDFLDPDQFVQAVLPSTSQIENLSSLLIDGTKSSLQWRSEEEQGASARSNRKSIQIFMLKSEHRDAKVLLHVGGKD